MEAEVATGEDGMERSIECLSLIDAVMPDVVASRRVAGNGGNSGAAGTSGASVSVGERAPGSGGVAPGVAEGVPRGGPGLGVEAGQGPAPGQIDQEGRQQGQEVRVQFSCA